jgi:hypothetical protein
MFQRRTMFAPGKRSLIIASALACFVAAGVLTPSDVRSQLDVRAHDAIEAPPRIEPPPAAIAPDGDAFAPRAPLDEEPRPTAARVLPMLSPAPAGAPVRPRATTLVQVTAIATGSHPTAVVDDGRSARVVTVGDRLGGSEIVAITDEAVVLADGRRLVIAP